jgi:hypothetical protein
MIICLVSGVPLNQHHTDSSLKARFPQHCLLSDGLAVAREMLGFQFEGRLIGGFPTAFPALNAMWGLARKSAWPANFALPFSKMTPSK